MTLKIKNLLKLICFFIYSSAFSQEIRKIDSLKVNLREIVTFASTQTLSPSLRLSDSLICAGEVIYIHFIPAPEYFTYKFEAINDNNPEFVYQLGETYFPKQINNLYISTENLLSLPQTELFRVQISAYDYLGTLLDKVILTQKLIVNPRPKVALSYIAGQSFEYRTLGETISINLIKVQGYLPFSFVIEDSIKVNMPVDTLKYKYDKKSNKNFTLDNLIDANSCKNSIEYNSTGAYFDFESYPQISERRVVDGQLSSKFFCKGEVLEVKLKVKGVVPPNLKFIPKYHYYNSQDWQELPVILDSSGVYLIQLPNDIEEGTYRLSFFPNDSKYTTELGYENEAEFTVVERIRALIYSNGQIKVNKNEAFSLRVLINKNNGNPTYINNYEVVLRTSFNKLIKVYLNNFDNFIKIDTLTRTTTFSIESIIVKGKKNQRFDLCEQAILAGQVTVEVFDKLGKDIFITSLDVFRNSCGEGTFNIGYSVYGNVVTGSNLKIQLKAVNSNNQDETAYFDVPTISLGNNKLEGILQVDTLFADYYIRVVSISNNLYGREYRSISNYAHPPRFQLTGDAYITASQNPVISIYNPKWFNDNDYYNISFAANGNNWSYNSIRIDPIKEITVQIPENLLSQENFTILPTGASGGYCGKASLIGSANIHIVQTSPIQISLVGSYFVCEGSKFYFNYNLSNIFAKNHKYKIRYVKVENLSVIVFEQPINLFTLSGQLYGIYAFGVGYNFEINKDYYVYLVSESPYAISEPITIRTQQRAHNDGGDINWQLLDSKIFELSLNFTGTPPFKFKYFDGDFDREAISTSNVYTFRPYVDSISSRSLWDSHYQIKITSLEDKYCVANTPLNFATYGYLSAKELAPIIIFPPNKLEVCQGATVKIPFKKDNSVSNVVLQFYHPIEKTFYDLNTTIGVDTVILTSIQNIPTDKPIYFRIKGVKDNQIVFSTSTHNFITFFSNAQLPTATLLPQTLAQKDQLQSFQLKVDFIGSAPWTLAYSINGQRQQITTDKTPYYLKLTPNIVTYNTTVTLNSVKNGCGTGNAAGTVRIIRANFDAYPEVNYYENFCQLSKVDFTIVGVGSFPNDTKLYFVSENLDRPDNVYEVPFTRKGGNLVEVTIPENLPSGTDKNNPKTYKIRAVCTSPFLEGNFLRDYYNEIIKVNVWGKKPVVTVTGTKTIVKGDSAIITFSMDKYVEGTSYTFNNWTYDFYDRTYEMIVKPTKDTTFRLTSATHPVCGADIGNPSEAIITVRLCPLETNISSDVGAGTIKKYQAEKIDATNKLNYQSRIEYNGEKSIILKAGFETKQGSIFKAQIKPCVSENLP